jgi:hypothetical protein
MRVLIGDHARQRFRMRGGTGKLSTARVERSLRHTLRMGAIYANDAVRTQIDAHLDAVCVPLSGAEGGGWLCATIVPREEPKKLGYLTLKVD